MRIIKQRDLGGLLVRAFDNQWGEIAYLSLGLRGLCAEIEFPSDWHDQRRAWVRLGFGLFRVAFSVPWSRVVPDEYQCSGPTYGFVFFDDGLHLHWGKCKGRRDDPMTIVPMPWRWWHIEHKVHSEPETHPFTYKLRSGEVQERTATIRVESRSWWRPWPFFYRVNRYISIDFNDEVGERSGSWKGGVMSCSHSMRRGESPLDTLRRMERERNL